MAQTFQLINIFSCVVGLLWFARIQICSKNRINVIASLTLFTHKQNWRAKYYVCLKKGWETFTDIWITIITRSLGSTDINAKKPPTTTKPSNLKQNPNQNPKNKWTTHKIGFPHMYINQLLFNTHFMNCKIGYNLGSTDGIVIFHVWVNG